MGFLKNNIWDRNSLRWKWNWLKRNAWNKSILYVRLYSYESIHTFCSEWICNRCFLKHLIKGSKLQNLEFRLNSRKEFNRPPFWLGENNLNYVTMYIKVILLESITGPRVAQLKCDAVWSENFWETNPKFSKCGDFGQLLAPLWKTKDINDGCT